MGGGRVASRRARGGVRDRPTVRAVFDVEREATTQATARVVDALLDTTTSAQQGKNNALLLAAAHDSLATLAWRLITGGADVEVLRPGDGFTPLCIACKHGNVVMVERLIAAGSRVNTASFLAASNNRVDVLKLLIAAGAVVNKARVADGCTPLHIAAGKGHAGVVSVLLETAGVDLAGCSFDERRNSVVVIIRGLSIASRFLGAQVIT